MNENKYLHERVKGYVGEENWENIPIPKIIKGNLNPKFKLRPYQEEAFRYFVNYWEKDFKGKTNKHQLLFRMATGSGKTLMMAGLILYLYEKGYRNFLFFVNSTNIIDKTRDNFFNDASTKYLFNKTISSDGKKITLQEVDNFQVINPDNINIAFSTIQGLHARLNTPQENSLTYEDFQEQKIVLISDEAHHLNVETKSGRSLSQEEQEEINSWENTVNKIFNANPQNLLLEFTATVDFTNDNIAKKYAERLIYDYTLKQFRIDGYSKDVKVMQTDATVPFDRALQAVLLSQYRRKIFEKNKQTIKPVILFKSRTISESKEFQKEFSQGIRELTTQKLVEIKANARDEILVKMFTYFANNKISLENLATELREDFAEEKIISVNSKEESEEKQLAVNSLEAPNNEYRVVFAVDKLNEGWDVLNLFDIVRLYDTRDAKNNVPGPTTIKEAQLIGRGARYCPFKLNELDCPSKRKFDQDIEHEMRICEELYYHSTYNPRYIQELNSALITTGILPDSTIKQKLLVKNEFKKTKFYKNGLLFLNKLVKYSRQEVVELPSSLRDTCYQVSLRTGFTLSDSLFTKKDNKCLERKEKDFLLHEFSITTRKKALYKLEFYRFSNLKKYFPNLKTLDEFIFKKEYLGNIKLTISGLADQLENQLTPDNELTATVKVLDQIATTLSAKSPEWRGSKEFKPYFIKDKITDKLLTFTTDLIKDKETGKSMNKNYETNIYLDINSKTWHVFNDCFGTSEEKFFVKYIDKKYDQLRQKYEEIYLLRNERFFKIYNFDDGKAFEPDYVLFLRQKTQPKSLCYQVFIEPKGSHFKEKDAWKEKFLVSLKGESKIEQLWEDQGYIIWGMPFYNKAEETFFDKELIKLFIVEAE